MRSKLGMGRRAIGSIRNLCQPQAKPSLLPMTMLLLRTEEDNSWFVLYRVSALNSPESLAFVASWLASTGHIVLTYLSAWVEFLDVDSQDANPNTHLLPDNPQHAQVAQHNNSPWAKNNERLEPPRGRLPDLDGARTRLGSSTTESRWKAFTKASAYPAISANGGERVREEWLIENGPDYSRPWLANNGEKDDEQTFFGSKAKRKRWWIRMQRKIIRSPMIPLVIRSIVWGFSMVALALGSSIHRLTVNVRPRNTTSADMAIAVDAVALVYLLYITYDEYTGKPLGLRSAIAKIRLIFLDLFFIVFDSANLSLAMESTKHNAINHSCSSNDRICNRQKALASVLLIALIAWLLTFSISVLR